MSPLLILASHSILDASKGVDFGQFIQAILSVVCLFIDSIVYYIVSIAFKLFLAISQFQIFSDTAFNDLINRTYVVIGVISLFLVAYALINAIISPDNASKGDKSASKIVKNIIVAIVGIAIVPTVFNWFYEFQSAVLCNNTIPKLLLNSVDSDGSTVENTATQFAAYLFEAFFYPNATSSVDGDATDLSTALEDVKLNIEDPIPAADRNYDVTEYTLKVAYQHAEEGKPFFRVFSPFILGNWFDNSIVDNTVQYLVILSTVAGGYCAYVLISLCIDMGLRAVKLGYLELIAPLAIMTKVVPGKDSVFKTWVKKTVSCALEVFVRLFVVVFVIYLINTIKDIELVSLGSKICGLKLGWFLVGILRALIYCSLFTFIKKAPKFFSEATGIKSDGFKIGIGDKLGEMAFIGGAAQRAEGLVTGAAGGLITGIANRNKIGIGASVMQGATQGFKGKGNQYSKQRKATFQSIGGYEDMEQGIFGGPSMIGKFIDSHKKDVKKDYTEHGMQEQQKFEKSKIMQDLKSSQNFGRAAHNKRITDFQNSDIYLAAQKYAEKKAEVTGIKTADAMNTAISEFLENTRATTQDKNLQRSINQYQKEVAAHKTYLAAEKFNNTELSMSSSEIDRDIQQSTYKNNQFKDDIAKAQKEIEDITKFISNPAVNDTIRNQETARLHKIQEEVRIKQNRVDGLDNHIKRLTELKGVAEDYANTINDLAYSVVKGEGTLDTTSGVDYKNTLDNKNATDVEAYREFSAGVKAATKVASTEDKLLEEIKKLNIKNNDNK